MPEPAATSEPTARAPAPPRRAPSRAGLWVPLAAAWAPILAVYADHVDQLRWTELLAPAAVALAIAALALGASLLLWRERARAGLTAGLLLLLLWGYTPLVERVGSAALAGIVLLLASTAGLFAVARLGDARVAGVLDRVAWIFLAVPVATALWNGLPGPAAPAPTAAQTPSPTAAAPPGPRAASAEPPSAARAGSAPAGDLPDIYLIVLDEFGRADVLRDYYGIEHGLAEDLAALGFYVADQSATNYTATKFAIPTVLNFSYVHVAADGSPIPKQSSFRLIKQNALMRELARRGYKRITFESGHAFTQIQQVDLLLRPEPAWSEFQVTILGMTPLYRLVDRIASPYAAHRHRVVATFERLPEVADDPAPTFTYVHALVPHPPFVFGEHGEDVSPYDRPFRFANNSGTAEASVPEGQRSAEYVHGYSAQTRYVSRLVADALRGVLARSERAPIIVVMGDHGPNSTYPRHTAVERLPILNAYYLPEGGEALLYPSISPVNSFRVVLSHYFGMDLPLLPDRHWITEPAHGFEPRPVTSWEAPPAFRTPPAASPVATAAPGRSLRP